MRLYLKYFKGFLSKRVEIIEVDYDVSTNELLQIIARKLGKNQQQLNVKLKRDGVSLKIIPGWNIYHYGIKEYSCLTIDFLETEEQAMKKKEEKIKKNLIDIVKSNFRESQRTLETSGEQNRSSQKQTEFNCISLEEQQYNNASSLEHSNQQDQKNSQNSFSDSDIEELLRLTTQNDFMEIQNFLDQFPETGDSVGQDDQSVFFKDYLKRKNILDQLGEGGWNALHYAIFCNHLNLVQVYTQKGANVNQLTGDGWTPLQLSISQGLYEITKQIIESFGIQINQQTPKGTALHIAVQRDDQSVVELLLQNGADPNLLNDNDQSCMELAISQNIKELLGKVHVKNSLTNSPAQKIQLQAYSPGKGDYCFQPPKPPIVKGKIFQLTSFFFGLQQRFIVVDPDAGTLIRYCTQGDFPLQPLQIIPLKLISCVQLIPKSQYAAYMKSDYYFLQIFHSERHLIACQHQETALKWVAFIYQAAVYALWMDENGFSEKIFENQKNDIVVLEDDPSEEKSLQYLKPYIQRIKSSQNSSSKSNSPLQQNRLFQDPKLPAISPTVCTNNNSNNGQSQSDDDEKFNQLETSADQHEREVKNDLENLISDFQVNLQSFQVIKTLGSGAFGKVSLVKFKGNNQIYAMKALFQRKLIIKKQLRYAVTEANILKKAKSPFIVGLHFAFQTPNYLYLVLDYCPGGDLSYHLSYKHKFSQPIARFYISQLVLAIEHLHRNDIVYRDLKPENVLLGEDGYIKLADFGLSKDGVKDGQLTQSLCGSYAYISPEMIQQKGAGQPADNYGIGAVLYQMLVGEPPYYSEKIDQIKINILEGKLYYPSTMSSEAKDLISQLLDRNPDTRLGSNSKTQIRDHPFFKPLNWQKLIRQQLVAPEMEVYASDDDEDDDEDNHDRQGDPEYQSQKDINLDYDYDERNQDFQRVIDFSFVKEISLSNAHNN